MRFTRTVLLVPLLTGVLACSGSGSESDDQSDARNDSSGETWCDVVTAANSLDDEFDAVDIDDRDAFKAVLDEIGELGPRFKAAAPDEIESQVITYAEANSELVDIFADADYDRDELDQERITSTMGAIEGIDMEIDVYTVAECGDSLGPDDT